MTRGVRKVPRGTRGKAERAVRSVRRADDQPFAVWAGYADGSESIDWFSKPGDAKYAADQLVKHGRVGQHRAESVEWVRVFKLLYQTRRGG